MSRYIIKIKDKYFEWSTIVDAPITNGMSLSEFRSYYQSEYGENGMKNLDERLKLVEAKGISSILDHNLEEFIKYNHAGDNETRLSMNEIYEKYQ